MQKMVIYFLALELIEVSTFKTLKQYTKLCSDFFIIFYYLLYL